MENTKPRHVVLPLKPLLERLIDRKIEKDLDDGEELCPTCGGFVAKEFGEETVTVPLWAYERMLGRLKAQEPRLLTFEDFDNNPEVDSKGRLPAWVEHNWKGGLSLTDDGYAAVTKQEMENWDRSFIRWWTSRPNKAQMEAIPWE